MADINLTTNTRTVVTVATGDFTEQVLDVESVVIEEPEYGSMSLSINTSTPAPDWYTGRQPKFAVTYIWVDIAGERMFTGYVMSWKRAKPPQNWIITGQGALYKAMSEWIVPAQTDQMLELDGSLSDVVETLLTTEAGYPSADLLIDQLPEMYMVAKAKFGLESVIDAIGRINDIFVTALWDDKDGYVHWGLDLRASAQFYRTWTPDDPGGDQTARNSNLSGGHIYGNWLWYFTRDEFWENDTEYNPVLFRQAMARWWNYYHGQGKLLAEHFRISLDEMISLGASSQQRRGNLTSINVDSNEDHYRNEVAVFGQDQAAVTEATDFDFQSSPRSEPRPSHLQLLRKTAIVSSGLIEREAAPEIARVNLNRFSKLYLTADFEADGMTTLHMADECYVDCSLYMGFARCQSITHTVDSNGFRSRGKLIIGPPSVRETATYWQYSEKILGAFADGTVRRWDGTFDRTTTFNSSTGTHEAETGGEWALATDQWDILYTFSSPGEVAYNGVHTGVFVNESGLYLNHAVDSGTLAYAQEWALTTPMSLFRAAAWAKFQAGELTTIERWDAEADWAVDTIHLCMDEPHMIVDSDNVYVGILASGMQFSYSDDWYAAKHIFVFKVNLRWQARIPSQSAANRPSPLFTVTVQPPPSGAVTCLSVLAAQRGVANPHNGYIDFGSYSTVLTVDSSVLVDDEATSKIQGIFARPLGWSFGAELRISTDEGVTWPDTLYGDTWTDLSSRQTALQYSRQGAVAFTSNTVRGLSAKVILSGSVADLNMPALPNSGSVWGWNGWVLYGGIDASSMIPKVGKTALNMTFEPGEKLPYPSFSDPYTFLTYAYTTEGVIHRQTKTWSATFSPAMPEYLKELWDRIRAAWDENGGMPSQDGQWSQVYDLSLVWARNSVARLINPFTHSFFCDNRKIVPGQIVSVWELSNPASVARNYSPCSVGLTQSWTEVLVTCQSPELVGRMFKGTDGRTYSTDDSRWEQSARPYTRRVAI